MLAVLQTKIDKLVVIIRNFTNAWSCKLKLSVRWLYYEVMLKVYYVSVTNVQSSIDYILWNNLCMKQRINPNCHDIIISCSYTMKVINFLPTFVYLPHIRYLSLCLLYHELFPCTSLDWCAFFLEIFLLQHVT